MGLEFIKCQSSLLYNPPAVLVSSGFSGGHWGTLMLFLEDYKKQFGEQRGKIAVSRVPKLYTSWSAYEGWRGKEQPTSMTINGLDLVVICGKSKR